jgi:hypothetical protein
MKKAAKILCIIALIFGLIWATVGFFGIWFGGATVSAFQDVTGDSSGATSTLDTTSTLMLRLLGSFVVVIIGGVLGIVGSDKKNSLKPIILGILTFICGFLLFPLSNYVAAAIYLVAGLLLHLAGLTTKEVENINEDTLRKKKLILSIIGIGIALAVAVGVYFILTDSPEKQTEISNEITIEEQTEQTMSPSDMFELGEKYYFDDKNYTEAAKWYRMSAEEGYAEAQYELGAMYYGGEGITQNNSEALKWFRKSADQGNSDAQNSLGHMYQLGDGVKENLSEAVKWYQKSAEQGNKYAQYNLGEMYEYGNGITQDYGKAIEWYQKAAKNGYEKANDKLEYLLEGEE